MGEVGQGVGGPACFKCRQRVFHGCHGRIQQGQRVQHDLEAHLTQCIGGQQRGVALFHQIGHFVAWHAIAEGAHFGFVLGRFEEQYIGADVGERPHAPHGFFKPVGGARIGARHDQDISAFVPRIDRRLDPAQRLVSADHQLAARMTAALRRQLVFNHGAGEAGLGIALDSAFDVERVAIAGIGIADHGDRSCVTDIAPLLDHFGIGDQAGIGQAEPRRGNREAAHEACLEAGAFNHPGRQGIETGRCHVDTGRRQQFA